MKLKFNVLCHFLQQFSNDIALLFSSSVHSIECSSTCGDTVDGPVKDPERRPFSNRNRPIMTFMAKNSNCTVSISFFFFILLFIIQIHGYYIVLISIFIFILFIYFILLLFYCIFFIAWNVSVNRTNENAWLEWLLAGGTDETCINQRSQTFESVVAVAAVTIAHTITFK